jgi:Flp pilus assembly protein TadD
MFINDKHQLADQLIKSGDYHPALSILLELITAHPDSPDLLSDTGVVFLHLNQEVECFEKLNQAIALQPEYSYRYACRAFAYNHFNKIELALIDYERAIELDPDDAVAHNNLGVLLEQKGYYDQAKRRFEQADKLAKAEENLLEIMDKLESPQKEVIQPLAENQAKENSDSRSTWSEFKRIFTSKKQRREFFRYLRNGFRLK